MARGVAGFGRCRSRRRLALNSGCLGMALFATLGLAAAFAAAPACQAPPRLAKLSRGAAVTAVPGTDMSAEDMKSAEEAYELWRDQFPLAAARREYYGLDCNKSSVQGRFFALSDLIGLSPAATLETFRRDFWVLSESTESLPPKLEALRSLAQSEEEVLNFFRWAPRSIATTTVQEIEERGLTNMLLRSVIGEVYELIAAPLRIIIKLQAKASAQEIENQRKAKEGWSNDELLEAERARNSGRLRNTAYFFFATLIGLMSWASYMDTTYGGPVHGKGFCFPAGVMPAYNIPDVEGNARLPCNCAPLYKWYLEPMMSAEQIDGMKDAAPKVESKNCGRTMGGEKRDCDPRTVGGCVWTKEDLARDPTYWEGFTPSYWEKQKAALK